MSERSLDPSRFHVASAARGVYESLSASDRLELDVHLANVATHLLSISPEELLLLLEENPSGMRRPLGTLFAVFTVNPVTRVVTLVRLDPAA